MKEIRKTRKRKEKEKEKIRKGRRGPIRPSSGSGPQPTRVISRTSMGLFSLSPSDAMVPPASFALFL
jgi:hypothetical protein